MIRVVVAIAVTALVSSAGLASAQTMEHIQRTLGPFVDDYPAGEICPFAYHTENIRKQNIKRFFDENGTLVRIIRMETDWFLHRNADTGYTLTETDHTNVVIDYVDGVATLSTITGNFSHLRDVDGRLVVVGSGREVRDLITGETLFNTPNLEGVYDCSVLAEGEAQ